MTEYEKNHANKAQEIKKLSRGDRYNSNHQMSIKDYRSLNQKEGH